MLQVYFESLYYLFTFEFKRIEILFGLTHPLNWRKFKTDAQLYIECHIQAQLLLSISYHQITTVTLNLSNATGV